MTEEDIEAMEIDWTQGVAENFERVKSAAREALDAANKRADELRSELIQREARRLEILDFIEEETGTTWTCDMCRYTTYHANANECANCGESFPFANLLAFKLHASGTDDQSYIETATAAIDAANNRAYDAKAQRNCYECGSEMKACAECNPELSSAALRARFDELEDKIDCLESDLSSAVDVLFRRGDDEAREWVRMNYPKQYAALKNE